MEHARRWRSAAHKSVEAFAGVSDRMEAVFPEERLRELDNTQHRTNNEPTFIARDISTRQRFFVQRAYGTPGLERTARRVDATRPHPTNKMGKKKRRKVSESSLPERGPSAITTEFFWIIIYAAAPLVVAVACWTLPYPAARIGKKSPKTLIRRGYPPC